MTITSAVSGRARPEPCVHVQAESGEQPGLTRSGHVVGRVYFSVDHGMHYRVVAATTQWQLAPDDAVALLWQNGTRTVTSKRRGNDLECRSFRIS